MFPQREFPSEHAMLETVYTRLLPARGYRVSWVMQPGPGAPAGDTADWNGTRVQLLPRTGRGPRLLRGARRVRDRLAAAKRVRAERPVDLIQVRNEMTGAAAAIWLSKRWNVPFVYQLSFPTASAFELEDRVEADSSGSSARRASIAVARMMQWRVLRRADLVLAISDAMRDDLVQRGLAADRVVSFPLGVDTSVDPARFDRAAVRRELGLDDVPTLLYFGSTDRVRKLEFVLDVMTRIRAELPEARLNIVGSAVRPEDDAWLHVEAARRGLGDVVRFVPSVPRAAVARWLVAADVSLSAIPPMPMYVVSSPTKVVESLGMAVPVVANREIPDQRTVITASGGGEAPPYDPGAFAEAALQVLRNPAAARAAGLRGRVYVERERSYARMSELVQEWYAMLFARRRGARTPN
jgi:glycosyltransferase involved in cell wall biosynthesis